MSYEPMLAAAASRPPTGPGWAYEPKYDGFRCLVKVDRCGRVRIRSRQGRPWTEQFPELAVIGRTLGRPAVLDGETIVLGPDDRPSFEALSARLTGARRCRHLATFVAFDVLEVDGEPVVGRPWTDRRATLEALDLDGERGVPTVVFEDGDALFEATGTLGVEGVVAKKHTSRYVCGRRPAGTWVKSKHRGTGWFDLVGWRPPTRSRPDVVVLAQSGRYVGTAIVALRAEERAALHGFIDRFGQSDGSGVRLPAGAQVRVDYTERSARGFLREATACEVRALHG